jgi:large subunit ribosomal protein L11
MAETIEVLVDGGKATPGQPLGPALGPTGINVVQVVQKINEKTKAFAGMTFEIKVGTPPTSALLFKEMGVEKGSGAPKATKAGDITMEQAIKVSEMKKDSLMGKDQKHRAKEVIGTCVSCGITVEGKEPKDILKEIDEGKWDAKFAA